MYVCVCKDVFSFQFVISRPVIIHIMRVSNEGSSIPRSRLKFSLNPVVRRFILANPDDVRVMIFLTSIDPLKGLGLKKLTEHNSAFETNTSSEAETSSVVKIRLSFQRWNVIIIIRGIVL